ncbi:LysM peptidoglycan-binding domain-containing protein [Zeimonas arvi]|uniref:LysM peptidoglycan-binding domain-containing protein n=2 Tax=Zeimonas arvi TaxID=2498847 RepID=A0A5C8NU69_9BURK|nr:LysM peptidoglycan-binding domain-containing protein [Zeimonas arvi]
MKNIITRGFALALVLTAGMAIGAQPLELAPNAPDRYTVVKGDTLWDISGRFLSKPWRWPEIWELNREQIRNPHLIYPGDIVVLDRSGASPRLRLSRLVGSGGSGADASGLPVERRQPQTRVEMLERDPVPTIDSTAIEPFLNRPLIVGEKELAANPRIVATQDGRVYLGRGDLAYARGIADDTVREWHVYRQAKPLLDPDTRKPIAWEALFVGSARLEKSGDPATLRITSMTEEIGVGDRLMPSEPPKPFSYVPRPPAGEVDGRILAVYRGVTQIGRNNVVAVNAGGGAGVEPGNVLAIHQRGRLVVDRETKEQLRLPDEAVGHLLVFRVFDNISYGLIMDASQSISVGDVVTNP